MKPVMCVISMLQIFPPSLTPLHQRSLQLVSSTLWNNSWLLLLSWQSCWTRFSLVFRIILNRTQLSAAILMFPPSSVTITECITLLLCFNHPMLLDYKCIYFMMFIKILIVLLIGWWRLAPDEIVNLSEFQNSKEYWLGLQYQFNSQNTHIFLTFLSSWRSQHSLCALASQPLTSKMSVGILDSESSFD